MLGCFQCRSQRTIKKERQISVSCKSSGKFVELLRDAVSINDLHRCHHSMCIEEQNDAVSPSEVLPVAGGELQCSFLYHKCYIHMQSEK